MTKAKETAPEVFPCIYAALQQFQNEVRPVLKGSTGDTGRSKYKYANILAVYGAIHGPLRNAGLVVVQVNNFLTTDDGVVDGAVVITKLVLLADTSQSIDSWIFMPLRKVSPQDVGSAITYARRYELITILGLETTDDDAQAAMPAPNGNRVLRGEAKEMGPPRSDATTLEKKPLPIGVARAMLEKCTTEGSIVDLYRMVRSRGLAGEAKIEDLNEDFAMRKQSVIESGTPSR